MSKDTLRRTPARAAIAIAALMLAGATAANADIAYSDFSNPAGLTFVGAAATTGSTISLTPPVTRVAGAAWYTDARQRVADGFETAFDFRISDISGLGADGIAFVIQNHAPDAIGGTGGAIGYANNIFFGELGIPNSLAVEFDTWNNSPRNWDDLSDNHVSIQTSGLLPNDPAQSCSMGAAELPVIVANGDAQSVRIVYDPGVLRIFVNGDESPTLEAAVDLSSVLSLGPDGSAWVGFTSATGGAADVERHELLRWSFVERSVPTPGALALLGIGGLACVTRRSSRRSPR